MRAENCSAESGVQRKIEIFGGLVDFGGAFEPQA
jgi:hypothetical protein